MLPVGKLSARTRLNIWTNRPNVLPSACFSGRSLIPLEALISGQGSRRPLEMTMSEPQTYSQLMRQHGAFRLIAASSLGRLVFGGLPLAMFIFIADARGSYGDAGAAL